MYEKITYESIMEDMLSRVPNTMDKREGSVIWDALAPAAIEMQNLYIQLDTVLNETFADTASLYYLKKRAAERGIIQDPASKAILKGEFTPTSINIDIGAVFSCNDLNYVVKEKITAGQYKLECETAGIKGNQNMGTLIPVEYIPGLETADLTELLIPGEDPEDVEHLRERYFASMAYQSYGGNVSDYKEKTSAIDGVGGVKVFPVWNGGGTVKLIITDSQYGVPTRELISKVQNDMDPIGHSGKGYGIAPIGHVVTVEGVKGKQINLSFTLVYQPGFDWQSTKDGVEKTLDKYCLDLSKTWENSDNVVVRISQIESLILDCEGVLDIHDTKINESEGNVALEVNEIPVRGDLNVR